VREFFPNAKKYALYDHHLAHVFSAYFSSGFSEAAVLVVDGQGKRIENGQDTMVMQSSYYCSGKQIEKLSETTWQDDRRIGIGTMYEMVTRLLDFSSEGTTM
jgi:carbamoyltransferase